MYRLMTKGAVIACASGVAFSSGMAHAASMHDNIAAYVAPYVKSSNFSGSILVAESGKVLFRDSYGRADIPEGAPNRVDTKYHIASCSMQFTAAAVMRLAEQGKLSLDAKVSDFVSGVPNGDKITVRELLQENSGLPDANEQADYDSLLTAHQTPESLVQYIRGRTPVREPGGPTQDEEHSAYNLLALIVEKVTGLPFKEVVRREVFAPLGMNDSGIDDDSPIGGYVALGHVENGTVGLKPMPAIHYSALPGNGFVYCTIDDERRWLDSFWNDRFLSAADRQAMLAWDDGYGWYKSGPKSTARFKETVYYMTGELPSGFASVIIYMPKLRAEIVVLSNLKIPVPTPLGLDIAAMLAGGEYHGLDLRSSPVTAAEMARVAGSYKFGPDFYRRNGTLQLAAGAHGLTLNWPGSADGPDVDSPVLVIDDHHFIDRHYWTRFSITDGPDGRPSQLTFGNFVGQRVADDPPAAAH